MLGLEELEGRICIGIAARYAAVVKARVHASGGRIIAGRMPYGSRRIIMLLEDVFPSLIRSKCGSDDAFNMCGDRVVRLDFVLYKLYSSRALHMEARFWLRR
jgi:hypothetical protein